MKQLWFLDYEASSLSEHSYPIEVGLAKLDLSSLKIVESHGWMIVPHKSWWDWDVEAEKIHGIPRYKLNEGIDYNEVARRLNEILGHDHVFCDSPTFDGRWNRTLFNATEIKPSFNIAGVWDLIHSIAVNLELDFENLLALRPQFASILAEPNPHRAEPDARLLADGFGKIYRLMTTTL